MGSNLISYPVSVGATEPSSPYSSFSYEPATMLNRCVMVKFDFLTAGDALVAPIGSSKDEDKGKYTSATPRWSNCSGSALKGPGSL